MQGTGATHCPLKKIAFTRISRVSALSIPEGMRSRIFCLRPLLDPPIDGRAGRLGVAPEIDEVEAAAVLAADLLEELVQERRAFLPPERVRDGELVLPAAAASSGRRSPASRACAASSADGRRSASIICDDVSPLAPARAMQRAERMPSGEMKRFPGRSHSRP